MDASTARSTAAPIPSAWRRPIGRRGLAAVAIVILVLVVVPYLAPYLGPWPVDPVDPVNLAFRAVGHLLWMTATLLALTRASTVRLGWLLLALTASETIWALQFVTVPALYFVTNVFLGVSSVILAHILVAFPSGALVTRFDRWLVAGIYGYFIAGAMARLSIWEPAFTCAPDEYCPRNPFAFLANAEFTTALDRLSAVLVPVLGILVLVAIARHWRTAGPAARRVLLPVVVAFPFVFVYNTIWFAAWNLDLPALQALITHPVANLTGWILPAAFLVGVIRARATRSGLPGAMVELGTLPTAPQLEAVLRSRLGDPDIRVVRWSRAQVAYLDSDGRPIAPPGPDDRRRLIALERDGEPVAGVILDAALDDPGLATTLTGLIGLTLDATDLREELRAHGGDAAGLPSGQVTFLFGDVERSTALLEALGGRYADLLAELRHLVGDAVDGHSGRVVDARADEVFAAFARATDAATAALGIQRRIDATAWPDGLAVRMRIGLHTGRPELTGSGYVGLDVHRAARVMAAANGGQIVATVAVVDGLAGDTGLSIRPLGRFSLRGLSDPVALVQLDAPDRPTDFPPLRADPAP